MLDGELYVALDPQLTQERTHTRLLLLELNNGREDEQEKRAEILKQLIPNAGADLWIQPPFYCDYGSNTIVGEKVFFDFNCVVLDVTYVRIGSRTLFGPNVQIYTATHPVDAVTRASGVESAKPIAIGEDVRIGGSAVINPGVTIGDRTIIGAGSVVTKDIPADVFAAGNPCSIIRSSSEY